MGTPQGPPLLYKSSNVSNVNTNTNINTKNITKQGQLINQRSISIYAYKSILFEILQNDHISKVTLFYDQTQPSPPSYILFHTRFLSFFFLCVSFCVLSHTHTHTHTHTLNLCVFVRCYCEYKWYICVTKSETHRDQTTQYNTIKTTKILIFKKTHTKNKMVSFIKYNGNYTFDACKLQVGFTYDRFGLCMSLFVF